MFQEINTVEYLIKNRLTAEDRIQIKQLGRPLPHLDINQDCKSKSKAFIRKFNDDIYKRNTWICGCPIRNRLFCFPCLLFAKSNEISWTQTGVADLSHLSQKIKKHEESAPHTNAIINFETLGKQEIKLQLDCVYRQNLVKHNDNVRKNRYVLSKIINCIKFCGAFELALSDNDESSECSNSSSSIFRGLINFTGELDSVMKEHLNNATIFKGTSKEIQNDLLDCILYVSRSEIIKEIENARFVSIIADEITDITDQFQLMIVFRYVLQNGKPVERFWTFSRPVGKDATSLANCIKHELEHVIGNNCNKLVSQSYDGANVMIDEYSGVQALIKNEYPYANFVHCYAHQLNLIIVQACCTNTQVRIFFSDIGDIQNFFSNSPQRIAILNEIVGKKIVTSNSAGWNFHSRVLQVIQENYDSLIECFERFESTSQQTNTILQARGLRLKIEQPAFKFWLIIFYKIMPHIDIISGKLPNRTTGPTEIFKAVQNFEEAITSIRDEIDLLANRPEFDQPPAEKRLKEDPDMDKSIAAKEICDIIISQMTSRFQFSYHLLLSKLLDSQNFAQFQLHFPEDLLEVVCDTYPFFNVNKIKSELLVLYMRQDLRGVSGVVTLLNFFIENNLHSQLSEICYLLTLLITIPMTTPEVERNFCSLKRIKTLLRSTLNEEDRLNSLAMMSIEKEFIKSIDNFNDQVIDYFASKTNRTTDFIFKTITTC